MMSELIDRQAAIDALRDATFDFEACEIVLKQLPLAQLSTNLASLGTDCISRQQAIEAVRMVIGDNRSISVCDAIKQLPTIQPKRGKWERHYSRPNVYADLFWHCSECGYKDSENYAPVYHHFCTNCGADMRGEQDG